MNLIQRIGLLAVFAIAVSIFALGIVARWGDPDALPQTELGAPPPPTGAAEIAAERSSGGRVPIDPANLLVGQVRRPNALALEGPDDALGAAGAEVFAVDQRLGPAAALRAVAGASASDALGERTAAPTSEGGDAGLGEGDADAILARAIAGPSGRFELELGAEHDAVQLVARAPGGFSPVPVVLRRSAAVGESGSPPSSPWPDAVIDLALGADLEIEAPPGRLTIRANLSQGALVPSGTPLGVRVARVGEAGFVRLFGLPPGIPLVIESDPDAFAAVRLSTDALRAGEVRSVRLASLQGGRFLGRVLDSTGQPLAGARVDVGWPKDPGRELRVLRSELTDGDGRFELDRLPAVELVGAVRGTGLPTLDFWLPPHGAARTSGGFVLEVGAGARLSGSALGPDGEPLAGVELEVTPERSQFVAVEGEVRSATSDASGAFEVRGLEGRRFVVSARAERADGTTLRGLAREVEAGVPVTVHLVPTATLRVVARDRTGAPVTELDVVGSLSDQLSSGQEPGQTVALSLTSPDGNYDVTDLHPGEWRFAFEPRSLAPVADVDVVVPTRDALAIDFEQAASVFGRVVDPDGKPIAGGRVTAWATRPEGLSYRLSASEATLTDADGRFELRRLRPGKLHLAARHPDFARSTWRELELGAGERLNDLELAVRRGAKITGRVLDENDAPLVDRLVLLHAVEAWDPVRLRTDENGRFEIGGLVPGEWQVMALGIVDDDPGAASVDELLLEHVVLADGGTEHVEFGGASTGGGVVRGLAPWAPAEASNWIYVRSSDGGALQSQSLRADGSFAIVTPQLGEHLISVVLEKAVERGSELFTTIDSVTPQDALASSGPLVLDRPDVRYSGRVTDDEGRPLAGVPVRIENVGQLVPGHRLAARFSLCTTDREGRFAFEWLTAGTYRVTIGGLKYVEGGPPVARWGAVVLGPLVMGPGEDPAPVAVVLAPPRAVSGRTVDRDGRPVPRATVFARLPDGQLAHELGLVHSDDEGRFVYDGLPAEGEVRFAALAEGLANSEIGTTGSEVRLQLEQSGRLVAEHACEMGGVLSVRDELGNEVAGRSDIRDVARSGGMQWEPGSVTFTDLAPGRYTVELTDHDGRRAVKYVQIEAGGERRVALTLLR
ncbi:carboxypeptidase regulatory-like domain-containing protein [Rohdeia mirabilis]|uniref:carboxypeptidase regulatory-like domain-containing protein n=1 Tax=Rohdeia mirabilis TaxID=2528008 RepID=UPI003AF33A46